MLREGIVHATHHSYNIYLASLSIQGIQESKHLLTSTCGSRESKPAFSSVCMLDGTSMRKKDRGGGLTEK